MDIIQGKEANYHNWLTFINKYKNASETVLEDLNINFLNEYNLKILTNNTFYDIIIRDALICFLINYFVKNP